MRSIKFVVCGIVILLLLSACSETNDTEPAPTVNSEAAQQTETPETPSAAPEPVTLKIAYQKSWQAEGEFEAYFIEPVRKRYPHITIEEIDTTNSKTTLEKLMIDGIIPDIVQSANTVMFMFTDTGMANNMEPLIKKHNFDVSKLNPVAVETVKTASGDDNLIGLPWTMMSHATYYNKDLFDRFGVSYPDDGMTWEEMRTLAVKLTRTVDGVQYRGLVPDTPNFLASTFGQGYWNMKTNKATINTDTWKRVFELGKSIHDIPGNEYFKGAPSRRDRLIVERTLAMYPTQNILPVFENVTDLNWDIVQFPSFKDLPNTGYEADTWILNVTKQSKHQDAAFQVIATVLSEEVQLEMTRNARDPVYVSPVIKQEFGKNMPYLQGKNLQAIFKTQSATALPSSALNSAGRTAIFAAYDKVMMEGLDVNTALRQADEQMNLKIAEALAQQ